MTKNETLHIRVNGDVKQSAENTLEVLGLSISEAVNIFLHQISLVGGLPFDVRIPSAPGSVIANNIDELCKMLQVGKEQIQTGKVIDANLVMAQIRNKYGFSD